MSEIRDLDKVNEELELTDVPPVNASPGDDDEAPAGEDGRGLLDEEREHRLPSDQESFPGLEQEPDIDEESLMSMDNVDAVLSSFEQEFRRKPANEQADDDDEQAESRAVLAESEADKASTEDRIEDSQNRHD